MKRILWRAGSDKAYWFMKDGFVLKPAKRLDRLAYQYLMEMVAREYLKGKSVLELYGGVGMATYRYSKYAKKVTRIDIDADTNECARKNLRGLKNIKFIEGDFLEELKLLRGERFDFIDADGHTFLDPILFNNFHKVLPFLDDESIGFHITNNYQFIVSRNFKHNYEYIEKLFGISFEREAVELPSMRCEIFNKKLAKAFEDKTEGKFKCAYVLLRCNVSNMVFLRKDLFDGGTLLHKCYKSEEVQTLIKSVVTKPLIEVKK